MLKKNSIQYSSAVWEAVFCAHTPKCLFYCIFVLLYLFELLTFLELLSWILSLIMFEAVVVAVVMKWETRTVKFPMYLKF